MLSHGIASGKIQAQDGFFLVFPATTGFEVIDLYHWLVDGEACLTPASPFPLFLMGTLSHRVAHWPVPTGINRIDWVYSKLLLFLVRPCVVVFWWLDILTCHGVTSSSSSEPLIWGSLWGFVAPYQWDYNSVNHFPTLIMPWLGKTCFGLDGFNVSQSIKFKITLESKFPSKGSICC